MFWRKVKKWGQGASAFKSESMQTPRATLEADLSALQAYHLLVESEQSPGLSTQCQKTWQVHRTSRTTVEPGLEPRGRRVEPVEPVDLIEKYDPSIFYQIHWFYWFYTPATWF